MEGQGNPPKKRAALSLAAVPAPAATVARGSRDRLSRLPDHLLGCILCQLPTKEAVKTSALARRWRDVWAQLPVLNFHGSVPESALAAYKAHGVDDVHSFTVFSKQMDAQHTTAWLSLAEPLLTGRLHFDNSHAVSQEKLQLFLDDKKKAAVRRDAFQLPCFKKATEILMDLGFLGLALPPAGVFDALRVMSLKHFWFRGQLSISDTMFPSLQELTIRRVRGLVVLTLNSKYLLNIHLSALPEFQQLNIVAPGLNKLEVTSCFDDVPGSVATIAAERLQVLRWEVPCVPELGEMPRLHVLRVPSMCTHWSEYICAGFLNLFPAVDHLELEIILGDGAQHFCLPDCMCHKESGIREAEVVPVSALERVDIINFHGALHEVYFVEQLVLRAPRLKLLRIFPKDEDDSLDDIEGICPAEREIELVVVRG